MGYAIVFPDRNVYLPGKEGFCKKLTLTDLGFSLGSYNAIVFYSIRTQEPGKRLLVFEPLLGSAIF